MYVEITPGLSCGRPPCPICYRWQDPNSGVAVSAYLMLARDLLGQPNIELRQLSKEQIKQLREVGKRFHEGTIGAELIPPAETLPPTDLIRLEGWLKTQVRAEAPAPRIPTLDDLAERRAARELIEKEKKEATKKRVEEMRDFARAMAQVEKEVKAEEAFKQRQLEYWQAMNRDVARYKREEAWNSYPPPQPLPGNFGSVVQINANTYPVTQEKPLDDTSTDRG